MFLCLYEHFPDSTPIVTWSLFQKKCLANHIASKALELPYNKNYTVPFFNVYIIGIFSIRYQHNFLEKILLIEQNLPSLSHPSIIIYRPPTKFTAQAITVTDTCLFLHNTFSILLLHLK